MIFDILSLISGNLFVVGYGLLFCLAGPLILIALGFILYVVVSVVQGYFEDDIGCFNILDEFHRKCRVRAEKNSKYDKWYDAGEWVTFIAPKCCLLYTVTVPLLLPFTAFLVAALAAGTLVVAKKVYKLNKKLDEASKE